MVERSGLIGSIRLLTARVVEGIKNMSYYRREIRPEIDEGRRVMEEVRKELTERETQGSSKPGPG